MSGTLGPNAPPQFPAGLVGDVAQFIFEAAPRPVREIALVGALGFIAGLVGRSFNISNAGLNLYLLLIAETGMGKEAIASGTSKLVKAVHSVSPTILDFVGPTEFASSQGLIKWLVRNPCIYSIVGEFGLKFKEVSSNNAPAHLASQRRLLLDLYHKSGHGNVLGAMAYANRENNTSAISSPSFTLIGESTPSKFFENVTEDVVSDGLLPRFGIYQFNGPLQPFNERHAEVVPNPILVDKIAALAAQCHSIGALGQVQNVGLNADAKAHLDAFRRDCDHKINDTSTLRPYERELWNRAHLKALKLAALYAVGVNYTHPWVDSEQARTACEDIQRQTQTLIAKFSNNEVGGIAGNEARQLREIQRAIGIYLSTPFEQIKKYGGTEKMHRDHIISASHIQRRLVNTAAFRVPGGATRAINERLRQKLEADELREVRRDQMQLSYGTSAKAFAIQDGTFILDELVLHRAGR